MLKSNGTLTKENIKDLVVRQEVLYTGTLYTARDQAHKRLIDMINNGEKLPFDIKDKIIYSK